MSDPEDDAITPVTADGLARIAARGIWTAGPAVEPAVAGVAEALIATLQGTVDRQVLPDDLQRLAEYVRRTATIDAPWITAADGARLSAFSIRLETDEPRPLVVVPSGWTPLGWMLFACTYLRLAHRGYHVLAYTPRGIGLTVKTLSGGFIDFPWTSQGTIDFGGPNDRSDGSVMIDYAQERFEPSAIAFLGASYGSGIGQLVAAHDPAARVGAVVALSTWGDLAAALLGNGTRRLAAVNALIDLAGGPVERKFDPATRRILADFRNGENLEDVRAWAHERSPRRYLEMTNARGIPTFFSQAWHETLFPVNQVLDTFSALTVPKHLNLWIGDHAAPEGAGLTVPRPGPDLPVDEAFAWLDHHLLGAENEVPHWPAVTGQVMFAAAMREGRPSWAEAATGADKLYLAGAAPGGGDGELGPSPATGWSASFTTGGLTEAAAVDEVLTTGQAERSGEPKVYQAGKFDRRHLAAWTSAPKPRRIRGTARMRLTVTATGEASAATLVAYLFDLAPDDTATIITHEPCTFAVVADEAATVDWPLQAAAYDLAADHRLLLVIGGKDPLYSDANPVGGTLRISSATGDESYLELPHG